MSPACLLTLGLTTLACPHPDDTGDNASGVAGTDDSDGHGDGDPDPAETGQSIPVDELPRVAPDASFVQLLTEPTELGENAVWHIDLPPLHNQELEDSLLLVFGEPENPLILVDSDALVDLGLLLESPGDDFFSAFIMLEDHEIERRLDTAATFGADETAIEERLWFKNGTPVGIGPGVMFDIEAFYQYLPTPEGPCELVPRSSPDRWEESLMITHLKVIRDPDRTWDSCMQSPPGNPDGVWTFHHLMSELAAGAVPAMTVEEFTLEWLETWLNAQLINGDSVPARGLMFDRVIKPWADASGATVSKVKGNNGHIDLQITGSLDWEHTPFYLSAIVNRVDLGQAGHSGYGGGMVSTEQTAGELRFVFGVQNPQTCETMPMDVIFEYGVPREGCSSVREWARAWTRLNDLPDFPLPRFGSDWRMHLETLTQSVVMHGAAPSKGNQSALNQIRTSEQALNPDWQQKAIAIPWEFREFTLTTEHPGTPGMTPPKDTPVSGPMRPHSVAMTFDDDRYAVYQDSRIVAYRSTDVTPSVGTPLSLPADCRSSYEVPLVYNSDPLRGGNSMGIPSLYWATRIGMFISNAQLCAEHELSLNTCNGCHGFDTGTQLVHIDTQTKPATLSNFLTGGSTPMGNSVWSILHPRFPNNDVVWTFAALDQRYARLYEIACGQCVARMFIDGSFLGSIHTSTGMLPIDWLGPISSDWLPDDAVIGPITSIDQVAQILEARSAFAISEFSEDVELGGFIRQDENSPH